MHTHTKNDRDQNIPVTLGRHYTDLKINLQNLSKHDEYSTLPLLHDITGSELCE